MKRALLVSIIGVLLVCGVAQGAAHPVVTVIDDSFESYGSQAAFQAAWPTWGLNNTSMTMNYDSFFGYPNTANQYPEVGWVPSDGKAAMRYQGPATANYYHNYKAFSERLMPNTDNPIISSFAMYDSGKSLTGALGNNREWSGILGFAGDPPAVYAGGAADMILVGENTATSSTVTKFQFRIYAGNSPGMTFKNAATGATVASGTWTYLNADRPGTAARPDAGWTDFQTKIYRTKIEFWVNGALDTTINVTNPSWKGFNAFHLGSGQSTNALMLIDNVFVSGVPEPASVVLLMGAGALLLRRRR